MPIPETARAISHVFVVSGSFLSVIILSGVFVTDMARTERVFRALNDWLERLLKRVLPPQIVERLRKDERTFAETVDECSILFADIVGFTKYCRKHSAVDVVAMLSKIFSEFDDLAKEHGVEKIKTIGDAYMVASGVPDDRKDHDFLSGFGFAVLPFTENIGHRASIYVEEYTLSSGCGSFPISKTLCKYEGMSHFQNKFYVV